MDSTEDEIQVSFMIETKEEGVFTWPGNEDVTFEEKSQVMRLLTPPIMGKGNRRHQYFKFSKVELEEAKETVYDNSLEERRCYK